MLKHCIWRRKMKTYRHVVIVVSIVLGIFVGIWGYFNSPLAKSVHANSTSPEAEYEYLKSIALTVAKGEEPLLDEDISVDYVFNGKSFEVTVKKEVSGTVDSCKLKAIFPMAKVDVGFVDGNVQGTFAIEHDKGSYNYSPIEDKGTLAYVSVLLAIAIPVFLFIILYWIPTAFIELVRRTKYKKWRIEDFQ